MQKSSGLKLFFFNNFFDVFNQLAWVSLSNFLKYEELREWNRWNEWLFCIYKEKFPPEVHNANMIWCLFEISMALTGLEYRLRDSDKVSEQMSLIENRAEVRLISK